MRSCWLIRTSGLSGSLSGFLQRLWVLCEVFGYESRIVGIVTRATSKISTVIINYLQPNQGT